MALGQPCSRCGLPMLKGQPIDLDHNDTGEGYRGFSHSACNRSTAGPHAKGYGSRGEVALSPQVRSATRW